MNMIFGIEPYTNIIVTIAILSWLFGAFYKKTGQIAGFKYRMSRKLRLIRLMISILILLYLIDPFAMILREYWIRDLGAILILTILSLQINEVHFLIRKEFPNYNENQKKERNVIFAVEIVIGKY